MFTLKPEKTAKPEPPRRPKREPCHYIPRGEIIVGPICTCIALQFPHLPSEHYTLKRITWDGDWRHFWTAENRRNFPGFRKLT